MEYIASHPKVDETKKERSVDKSSPEFLQARADRIEKRRARIALKAAAEKRNLGIETNSTPSSLEFLQSIGAVGSNRNGRDEQQSLKTGGQDVSGKSATGTYTDAALDTQMEESRKQLEEIILDGETLITNVKVAAEYREKTRHDHVDESRNERLDRLQKEAQESQEMYEQIQQQWMATAEHMLPMELYAKIQEQKKACDDLLEKQDEELYNLRKELEDQDIEYENNLEMYQKDIMLMGDRIDDNVDTLRSAFMEELDLIEEYTVQDREQLLEDNQKEWMGLLKEYEELEKKSLEDRKNEALNKFEKLTDLYGNVKQEARLLKNKMLTDMRTLFVEREKVKCAIQLNLEKLDYNLSVLRKREEENMRMKNSMKRLLLKLKDRFNLKTQEHKDRVTKGKKQSEKLIKDIRRLEVLCDNAKRKTLHVYASDYHKFMDLWLLSETECREKLFRLLGSERYIVEEQLGTGFFEPDISILDKRPKEVQCFKDRTVCCTDIRRVNPFLIKGKSTSPGNATPAAGAGNRSSRMDTTESDRNADDLHGGLAPRENNDLGSRETFGRTDSKTDKRSKHVNIEDIIGGRSTAAVAKAGVNQVDQAGNFFTTLKSVRSIKSNASNEPVTRRSNALLSRDQQSKPFMSEDSSKVTSMMSFLHLKDQVETVPDKSAASLLVDPASDFDFCPGPEPDPVVQRRLMKHITKVICDQTGFLLEDKLRKIMLPLIDTEKNLIHIDTVLQALGVNHISEMQILARYMLKYSSIMKGIISRTGIKEPSQERMAVSPGGIADSEEVSEECASSVSSRTRELNVLKEEKRLTPSTTETDTDVEELEKLNKGRLPSSAADLLTKSIFNDVAGIEEVHGVKTIKSKKVIKLKKNTEQSGAAEGAESVDELNRSETVLHIIEEFSSDESLANVLQQVETYGKKLKDGTFQKAICPAAADDSSSECSCDSLPQRATAGSSSSESRLGPDEDSLGSNKATVFSWVTKAAAGLTADCLGEDDYGEVEGSFIEEIIEGDEVDHRTAIEPPVPPCTGVAGAGGPQGLCPKCKKKKKSEKSKEDVDIQDVMYGSADEEWNEQEFEKRSMTPRSSNACVATDESYIGEGASLPTTAVGSTEFFYIEPNDVLRALAAFCRDHKSKVKTGELPTKAQLCENAIGRLCFPSQLAVKEYWGKYLLLADPKSTTLWDGILDVFKDYHDNLKVRNQYVEDIVRLYKQNYELSHLLKKHIMTGTAMCRGNRAQIGPYNPTEIPFCENPCSALKPNKRLNYPQCEGPTLTPVTTAPAPGPFGDVQCEEE